MSKPLSRPVSTDLDDATLPESRLPSRNFARARKVLLFILAVTVAVPLGCLAGYGYYTYKQRYNNAVEASERMSRVAQEQALKVMDLNTELVSRVDELLADQTDEQIVRDQADIHRRLEKIAGGFPQVAAISAFGTSGQLLVSSRFYPVPAVNIQTRDDFINARHYQPEAYVSLPMQASVSKVSVFNVAQARRAADGQFHGVISVALRRDYFSSFYQKLVDEDSANFIGLYRRDGSLLTSFPNNAPGLDALESNMLANAFSRNEFVGQLETSTFSDGQKRFIAYRRVDGYGLYVAVGFPVAELYSVWLHHFILICALAGLPCIGIWLLIGFSLKQLSTEENSWMQWRTEAGRRLDAEEAARHLQRASALGNLVASVAHDVNNYLVIVKSNMAMARSKGYRETTTEMASIERATRAVESLVRTLMGSARKQPVKLTQVNPAHLLPKMQQVVQATVGDSVATSIDVAPEIWTIRTDVAELELAIVNLALNARDAMHRAGKFSVRAQNVEVASHSVGVPAGDYVMISASDNGEGMSAAVAMQAFEPLFTTKTGSAHPGLGLSQVMAVCEASGGTAKITSEPGVGTTVRLYFPRSSVRDIAAVSEIADSSPVAGSQQVLLIEDNHEVAASLSAVLEMMGHAVTHYPSADDALPALQSGQAFKLVLSDVQMPGDMNGIDLAEWVKQHRPEQPLVLMTGYADELERAKHMGVPIFAKPFDAEDLEALLGA
ncbi:hybrid sensor histidine kinase/response regulator [Burkholderia sp. Ac-20365]|uniref:hybrid sensor histidine kinase/response regulator n=1 Tax=Burkholderia sp. Ac-20365 TaxID=2703897 RepID=UPI00197B3BFF|nr:hybrid sensor histidine kinase/response regulator [Burkholderia sp. Ac-20365]MBN3765248.1 response regulator [Burkholderia sp. Ac-20365]